MVYTYYNLTELTNTGNSTNILSFIGEINTQMNGFPSIMILSAIYIVLLVILIGRTGNVFQSFAATSFAMLVLALISYPMGLIGGNTLIIFSILPGVAMFLLWVWGGKEFG